MKQVHGVGSEEYEWALAKYGEAMTNLDAGIARQHALVESGKAEWPRGVPID